MARTLSQRQVTFQAACEQLEGWESQQVRAGLTRLVGEMLSDRTSFSQLLGTFRDDLERSTADAFTGTGSSRSRPADGG